MFAASDRSRRAMDVREFLYMLKVRAGVREHHTWCDSAQPTLTDAPACTQALGITDSRNLTLYEACRVMVAVTGFIGDVSRQKVRV